MLMKRCDERRIYSHFEWLARTADKAAMAQAFRARAAMGKVYIPHSDWGDRLLQQLCAFPAGKHDDAVDVCALIGMALDEIVSADHIIEETNKPKDRWDKAFDDDDEDSWKVA
jgi:predicted phage terminase large subunit-like protein